MNARGTVYLVGGGPGDPSLITLRGQRLLRQADVVIYDRLAPHALLSICRDGALKIDAGKSSTAGGKGQNAINAMLVEHAQRGQCVVRLKGGDPGVFGRAAEERAACLSHGIRCIIVPGVSSCLAAPASVGMAVTQRGISRAFTVVTARDRDGANSLDYETLAGVDTLVVLMGRKELARLCRGLIEAGRDPDQPVVCVERATTHRQRECRGCLQNITERVEQAELQAPMVTIVGDVAGATNPFKAQPISPLIGLKVAVTGSQRLCSKMAEDLLSRGAEPIPCPLIRIDFPDAAHALDQAIGRLNEFDWLVFSSANGVRGFFKRLHALGKDSRTLANCCIATVGEATARALMKHELRSDVVPAKETGAELAKAVIAEACSEDRRVLLPRSDRALTQLLDLLRAASMTVTEAVAYRTVLVRPSHHQVDEINSTANAILFSSPSAVECALDSGICCDGKFIVCIGETTAAALERRCVAVDAIAERSRVSSMVDAVEQHFAVGVGA